MQRDFPQFRGIGADTSLFGNGVYLRQLRSDFDKLSHLIIMTAAASDRDRPDLTCVVMKTRVHFYLN
jgi:hypothetical protein